MNRSTAAHSRKPRGAKKQLPPVSPAPAATPSAPRTAIGAALQRRYLTRHEAAAYLGFSVEKLIKLVKAKQLPEYDFGPFTKRYLPEDLDAFAQARRREAIAAEALLG